MYLLKVRAYWGETRVLPYDRHDTLRFLCGAESVSAGPGALAANVQHVGALRHQLPGMAHGSRHTCELAAIAEAVWSDVQDAHDLCPPLCVQESLSETIGRKLTSSESPA